MSAERPVLVPVLGMHRSGTSIATRGLACLGVALGDDLVAGSADDNPTGYFEDAGLHAICEAVLEAVGSRWDDLAPIEPGPLDSKRVTALENDAVALLRRRLDAHPVFAFKDPRTSRLRAFFEPVLARLGADVRGLLVVRHPLSVVRSLEARDGFDPAKSAQLWLTHALEGALGVGGPPRVCLDYDALIDDPTGELTRVGEALGLGAPRAEELEAYRTGLLDRGLRHTAFGDADLEGDPRANALVRETWRTLRACARGEAALADDAVRSTLEDLRQRAALLEPLRILASRQERRVESLTADNDALREQVETQQRMIEDREALIEVRDDAVRDLDAEIERQHAHIESLKTEIVHLKYEAGTQGAAYSEASQRIANLWSSNEQLRADHARAEQALHARLAEALARVEALQAERTEALAGLEDARRRIEALADETQRERAEELAAANHELAYKHSLIVHARTDLERQRVLHAEAQQRADELQSALEAERQGSIAWFHAEAVQITRRLVEAAEALRATRAWQWSRGRTRGRGRDGRTATLDATEHLRDLLVELQARARRHDIDARTLLDFTRLVDETKREILHAPRFRALRRASASWQALRRARPAEGPVELLERGIGELIDFAGRMARAPFTTAEPTPDAAEVWLEPRPDARVDVVIPVYGDREATLDCIASVRRSRNRTPSELVVIDDATPDAELARALDELARAGEITLVRNDHNLGFPATANRGMALHPDRDVVLLNADTRVNGDWLDRLRAAAHSDWNVATATPFSNNAEICSYPLLCTANPYPSVPDHARIDAALARVNAGRTLTIPTAVGFCMYLRRDALRRVGPFDALRFERGYGEENDLCMRLRARGLRNVLAADVYVAHAGGGSFGAEKQALVERGLERLAELHPDYQDEVAAFIDDDPMRPLRVRAEAALLPRAGDPTLLFVTHARGGGTERHVRELGARLEREGVRVLRLAPDGTGRVGLSEGDAPPPPNLCFDADGEFEALLDALRIAGVAHVHFHHLIGLPDGVARLPQRLGVTYDVTAHDYFAVCPRTHMIDESGLYCGEPEVEVCTQCVARIGSPVGHDVDVARWRTRSQALLAGARRVFVPSEDAAERLARYFEDVRWLVRPHLEAPFDGASAVAARRRGERRVAVVGAVGYHKGSRVLLDCARDAAERRLPLRFEVVGFTDCDEELLATKRVAITGPYEEDDLPALLARARCQLALLPSVWPETYCYTLSHVVRARLHPVVFDIGAPAARVRAMGFGDVLPLGLAPGALNDRLLEIEPMEFPRDRVEAAHAVDWPSCLKDYYDGLALEAPESDTAR